jgi:tetratricopeptide (TPR) repeat protein
LLLAGELFSRLKDAESIEMAACALYLAGEREEALRFWEIVPSLSAPKSDTQLRALYNSASLGSLLNIYAKKEYISSLEQLFLAVQDDTSKEGISIPALVLYTRLLPEERALAMLQSEERSTRYALLDLELFKRNAARAGIPRTAGETWFLLNRHPADEDIYQWAAWYFEYQKLYSDSEFLFHFAEQNNVSTPALVFNKSLYAMRNEDFSGAEKLFTQLKAALPAGASGLFRPKDGPWSLLWAANANLGIIYEARRAAGQALANYEEAVRLLEADFGHAKDRARLYLRIAHCYEVLGRRPEIRPLLEKALELDGENVNVHRALNRLTTRQD